MACVDIKLKYRLYTNLRSFGGLGGSFGGLGGSVGGLGGSVG